MIIQKKEMVKPSCFIYGRRLLSKLLHTVTQYYWNHLKMEYLNELCEY